MFDAKTKVLVVDDMSTMRKLVTKACNTMGLENITEAEDGAVAWQKIQTEGDYNLIISDWNMPNCTGIELLKRVRMDAQFKKLPFVLLTAETEAKQITEAIQAGVSNYIIKPFTPESLKEKLEQTYKKVAGA